MSSDANGNGGDGANRQRRSSITQAALSNLFQRGNSVSGPPPSANDANRRRLSVTTIGLSGTQQNTPPSFQNLRRGSLSTNSNSDSIDESAVEEDDAPYSARTAPNTPFVRRTSFGGPAMRFQPGKSPGNDQSSFNWSEQLRSRAESSVSGARPSFSMASSPPRGSVHHERAKSVAEMPQPPSQAPMPKPQPIPEQRKKPDAFQERILKGDFYMD